MEQLNLIYLNSNRLEYEHFWVLSGEDDNDFAYHNKIKFVQNTYSSLRKHITERYGEIKS